MISLRQSLAFVLSDAMVLVRVSRQSIASPEVQPIAQTAIQPAQMTPEQLQQLVAPIASFAERFFAFPNKALERRYRYETSSISSPPFFYRKNPKLLNRDRWKKCRYFDAPLDSVEVFDTA
jgi:hypothetical protein